MFPDSIFQVYWTNCLSFSLNKQLWQIKFDELLSNNEWIQMSTVLMFTFEAKATVHSFGVIWNSDPRSLRLWYCLIGHLGPRLIGKSFNAPWSAEWVILNHWSWLSQLNASQVIYIFITVNAMITCSIFHTNFKVLKVLTSKIAQNL